MAEDVIPDVKLLVSELVTNSVKYGGEGALRLRIAAESPRKLRAEVIDQGVGFVPVVRDRPATDVGGWGLHLVQTLSNRWGLDARLVRDRPLTRSGCRKRIGGFERSLQQQL